MLLFISLIFIRADKNERKKILITSLTTDNNRFIYIDETRIQMKLKILYIILSFIRVLSSITKHRHTHKCIRIIHTFIFYF